MNKIKKMGFWVWDNYEKLLQVGALLLGFGLPAWAAHVSPFMREYAPLSWVLAGFGGLIAASIVMAIGAWTYSRFMLARRTAEIIENSRVNPLMDRFDRETIRMIDFYHPHYVPHENKDFRNCEIIGPGMVYFEGFTAHGCFFRHVQIVVVATNQELWGMTYFKDAKIIDCKLTNLTLVMNQVTYDSLDHALKLAIPKINS